MALLALMNLEGPRGAGRSIGPRLLLARPPFPKASLRFRLTFKEIRDNLAGKLWPWPHLASVGYGQRESYHPIENWTDSVLARDQLSCGCRWVVVEVSHEIPLVNNNGACVLSLLSSAPCRHTWGTPFGGLQCPTLTRVLS